MPFVSLEETKDKTFDYVVVGGGAAGLALAARLTEDSDVTVLVLEAGGEHLEDPAVFVPGGTAIQIGDPQYDWNHQTTPQKYAGGKKYNWNRGKGLGGSTSMNFMCFIPPHAVDVDSWEKLGNPGWNFADYKKYLDRATSYRAETNVIQDSAARICEESGTGPVKISYPPITPKTDLTIQQTLTNMGVPIAKGPNSGDPAGTYFALNVLDPKTHHRSYSASAYFAPNASRPNFCVLLRAYACRIAINGEEEPLTATGVEFTCGDPQEVHVVHARKEVVLCAGALKSTQILELSGIGRPDVLSSIGVPVKLALDGVGENVQEHNFMGASFLLKDSVADETYDILRDPEQAAKHAALHPQGQGVFNIGIINFTFLSLDSLSSQAEAFVDRERLVIEKTISSGIYPASIKEQYELQMKKVKEKTPGCELAIVPGFMSAPNPPLPGKKYVSIINFTNYPFSRGSIHCVSKDPHVDPAYDPHYFEHGIDLQTMVEIVKYSRKVAKSSPFEDLLESTESVNPGPEIQTDEELREWVKENVQSTYHTAGPLSMLPREKGGVVDPQLKVYGTTNIRVADMSVVPLHFAGHAQSTAYVIGEKAADIIKGIVSVK